jgi:hypothetical protein
MTDIYAPGESVHVTASFAVEGTPTDPGTVRLTFQSPSGELTIWEYGVDAGIGAGVFKTATGSYYADIPADAEGVWAYRFVGTLPAPGAAEGWFIVSTRIVSVLDILLRPMDYDAIRAMLGVERVDLDDDILELPAYGPYMETRVKALVPDWETVKEDATLSVFLRAAVRYGVAAELAESYVKGGTVSLVHREEPRRNWSEWARIFWQRYEEALARITTSGVPDDDFDVPTGKLTGPTRSRGTAPDWTGVYPPVWPETPA